MTTPIFDGDFEVSVGPDGALQLPSPWTLHDSPFVAFEVHYESCVRVYPTAEWEQTSASMKRFGTPLPDSFHLTLERNRVLRVPRHLLEAVQIKDRAVVVGNGTWIELWSVRGWIQATTGPVSGQTLWSKESRR